MLDPTFTYTYDFLIADTAGAMYAAEIWSDHTAFIDLVADLAPEDQSTPDLGAQREQLLQRLEQPLTLSLRRLLLHCQSEFGSVRGGA